MCFLPAISKGFDREGEKYRGNPPPRAGGEDSSLTHNSEKRAGDTPIGWVVLCKNELFKNGGVAKFSHIWQEFCPKIFLNLVNV